MPHENPKLMELVESRRHAVEQTLHSIDAAELKALSRELFPYADHPWRESFPGAISEPASGIFYHGVTEASLQVLYCPGKKFGMWFIPGLGKGLLPPEALKVMNELVEARCSRGA